MHSDVIRSDAGLQDRPLSDTADDRFRRFAKHSSQAFWIADYGRGHIAFLSAAAANIWTGLVEGDPMDALAVIIHPEDVARTQECRREVGRGHVQRFDYRIVNASGEIVRHVRETSFPIPDDSGNGGCIGGIVEDISPERQIYLVLGGEGCSVLLGRISRQAHRIKTIGSRDDLMRLADVLAPGCVVLDLRGCDPDPAGIATLLAQRPDNLQIVLVGAAATPASHIVAAIRAGASDYLIEPIDDADVERAIARACGSVPERAAQPVMAPVPSRLDRLPKREREVLDGLIAGGTNKSIARVLGISPRTVEVHRAHLMERLNAHSLSELLQIAHYGVRAGA